MKRFLNVGGNRKSIPVPTHYEGWDHVLLDIDPAGAPDVLCDARELSTLEPAQFDAVYCSHNLEHFFEHDVPKVLTGFAHVLKPAGWAEIRVPDIGALMATVAERKLDIEDALYTSPSGAVRVKDVMYGFAPKIAAAGNDFFAHKTGFTHASLRSAVSRAGFRSLRVLEPRLLEIAVVAFKVDAAEARFGES